MHTFTLNNTKYTIRLFDESRDSVEELTDLLHRAYKRLADMGLNFIATFQSVEYTRNYLKKGECYILESEGKLMGTVFYYTSMWDDAPEIYKDPDSVLIGKFAVEPELQKLGLGSMLMDFVESLASERKKKRVVLDTSEKALHLIDYYNKRGYEYRHHWQWPDVNYKSVVLSKEL
ncbi:MAG TPA: GNAT family N-acetyltransferase [Ignavibacteria bacterium]|nr:GNAT family N-acetyltransferase [Ignavibacteria bacterium]HMQ99952.1 GNAT family N-acetyltransferase [Ignavibacteria bacterium]